MKIVVGRVSDFAPGEKRIVEAGNRSIGVFRIRDKFYALANYCPHQGGPLCLGHLKPWLHVDGSGQPESDAEDALVACPWHGWEYEIATGQSFRGSSETPALGFGVSIASGSSLTSPPESDQKRVPGPYIADTFDVQIDEDYVVVDTSPRARPRITDRQKGDTSHDDNARTDG